MADKEETKYFKNKKDAQSVRNQNCVNEIQDEEEEF